MTTTDQERTAVFGRKARAAAQHLEYQRLQEGLEQYLQERRERRAQERAQSRAARTESNRQRAHEAVDAEARWQLDVAAAVERIRAERHSANEDTY